MHGPRLQTIRTVASQSVSAGVAGGVLGFGISVAAQGFSMRPVASLAPAATAGFLASIATFFVAEEVLRVTSGVSSFDPEDSTQAFRNWLRTRN